MHDVLEEMLLEDQSIVGGYFSTNSNLMATYIESFVRIGLLPRRPQLCMGKSGWQACACIVNSSKCTASPDDMDKNETDTQWAWENIDCIRIKLLQTCATEPVKKSEQTRAKEPVKQTEQTYMVHRGSHKASHKDGATEPVEKSDDDYPYPYPVYEQDDIVALLCMLVQHAFRKMPGETLETRARAVLQQKATAYSDAVLLELANIAGLLSHHHGVLRDTAAVIEHWRECDQTRRQLIRRVSNWSCQTQPPFTHDDELGRAEVQQCFFQYGINFLQHQLQPHQKRDQRYVIQTNKQGQTRLDAFQRSTIQSVLWRRIGSKFIAFGIWQIGLPRIIASDDAVGKGLLQSCLTEVLGWLVRLVEAIDHRKGTAEHADHVRMSDPTQRTWSDDNRKRKWQESNKAKPMKPFRL